MTFIDVTAEWLKSHDAEIRKHGGERVLKTILTKLDACISSCPSEARQKPITILKRVRETVESLRSAP